jgi:hypothetical protein
MSKILTDHLEKEGVTQEEWDREAIEAVKAYRARHGGK